MSKETFDIGDNEIRVVGSTMSKEGNSKSQHRWRLWIGVLLLFVLILLGWMLIHRSAKTPSSYEPAPIIDTTQVVTFESPVKVKAYTQVRHDTINDIPLCIYTPIGGHVELLLGKLPDNDKSIILAAQAADYRADNGQISGAFVYKGELLSRGHPKYGFCAIIGDKLTMGMSPETPLFERAVEQNGYFFRQFSLVHDGQSGETLPKGKSVRRALCYFQQTIVVVESVERESLHDFSQALIDMGVQEAVALVGSVQLPLYEDEDGNRVTQEVEHWAKVQETYIVWRK